MQSKIKSIPIHPFLPPLILGKVCNRCKYMLATNTHSFAMKNCAQQQARAPSNTDIPKWEQLPNREIVIQTHPLQSMPPHPPRGADKGPICVIKSPEPKYIIFPPKNGAQRAQRRETVSGHLGKAVSHVVDTCLQCHQSRPTVLYLPLYPALPSGTLGRSTTLPADPKDHISHPNQPRLPGKYPGPLGFLGGGVLPICIDAVR